MYQGDIIRTGTRIIIVDTKESLNKVLFILEDIQKGIGVPELSLDCKGIFKGFGPKPDQIIVFFIMIVISLE